MHCTRCNTPLQEQARFCSRCGLAATTNKVDYDNDGTSTASQSGNDTSPPAAEPEELPSSSIPPVVSILEQPPSPVAEPEEPRSSPILPAVSVLKQPRLTSIEARDTLNKDSIAPSDHAQHIIHPSIPARPQHAKQPPNTPRGYKIPGTQMYAQPQRLTQPGTIAPTLQISPRNVREHIPQMEPLPETPPPLLSVSPNTPSPSLSYFRLDTSKRVIHMFPAVVNSQTQVARPRRRGGFGCLLTLLVLVLVIGGGWFFAFQPYLHNLAEDQLNQAMTAAVNQIPPGASALPTNSLKISETVINNLIVLNTSPSSPVQSPATHITPANIQLDFQLYGQPCAITEVPQVQNNQLIATNVTVNGIIGLVLSPADITNIINRHLVDAQNRIHHSVKSVQLKDHEVDLTLG